MRAVAPAVFPGQRHLLQFTHHLCKVSSTAAGQGKGLVFFFLENSKCEGTNPRGRATPEAGVKPECGAGGQRDASPWDERVKISAAQLSEGGQGSGSTSGTQWELPEDASWH